MKGALNVLFATLLLAFAGTASSATFDIDENGNILFIGALELNFDESSPQEDGLYNIEFVYDTGINQYGNPPVFDVILSEDAVALIPQINDALNAEGGITGAGSNGDDTWYIPGIEFFDAIYASGASNLFGGEWGVCRFDQSGRDCLSGVAANREEDVLTYARVTLVPVPAAVWLFGSALGLLGWVRRRAA